MGAFNDAVRAMELEAGEFKCYNRVIFEREQYENTAFAKPSLEIEIDLEDNSGRPLVEKPEGLP